MKSALKAFVVPVFVKKYQVCAVRALCGESADDIWLKRRRLEATLLENEHVVAFFSSITALEQTKKSKKRKLKISQNINASSDSTDTEDEEERENEGKTFVNPGVSFWVVFGWPEYGLAAFEEHISREFMLAGVDLDSCKAIRERGRYGIF